MKKALAVVLLLIGSLNGFSQSQLFSENFESASSAFTLNTTDVSSTSAGANVWLINDSYMGGSGTVVCLGFPFSYSVGNTVAQPSGIANSPNSKYLHITSQASINSGITCANFFAADGLCTFDENNFTKMSSDISTMGLSGISLDFWWLCGGSAQAYGEVYYSIDGGNTWVLQQSNFNNTISWSQSIVTNPAWDNQATLRFGFRFVNQTTTDAQDPGFCIDDIQVTTCSETTATISETACNSYTSPSGNYVWTTSNTYLDTIPNSVGCDSVITVNLTILNPTSGTDTQTACNSYTWIDGNTYTSNNTTATFNIIGGAANGCDSLVTLNLIISTVSNVATTVNGLVIQAANANASYRWLDCNANYNVIVGETGQSFTASTNGSYAVEITENTCVDTSECVTISNVGIIQNDFVDEVNVYPNPTQGNVTVNFGTTYGSVRIALTDISGQLIQSQLVKDSQEVTLNLTLPAGIYFMYFETENKKAVIRLVKE